MSSGKTSDAAEEDEEENAAQVEIYFRPIEI